MSSASPVFDQFGNQHRKAARDLLPLVYIELRKLAELKMVRERPGQTLSATALVHEAFLRLTKHGDVPNWDTKGHFFAAAAEAMRRILIEVAERKSTIKRGGDRKRIDLEAMTCDFDVNEADWSDRLLELNSAIQALEGKRPEAAELVKLRYFGGMKMNDAANAMGISERTAHRYWQYAKAWLFHEIHS